MCPYLFSFSSIISVRIYRNNTNNKRNNGKIIRKIIALFILEKVKFREI